MELQKTFSFDIVKTAETAVTNLFKGKSTKKGVIANIEFTTSETSGLFAEITHENGEKLLVTRGEKLGIKGV